VPLAAWKPARGFGRAIGEAGLNLNLASAYEVIIRKCSLIFLKAVDLTVPLARR
jgi:hypothetical protein